MTYTTSSVFRKVSIPNLLAFSTFQATIARMSKPTSFSTIDLQGFHCCYFPQFFGHLENFMKLSDRRHVIIIVHILLSFLGFLISYCTSIKTKPPNESYINIYLKKTNPINHWQHFQKTQDNRFRTEFLYPQPKGYGGNVSHRKTGFKINQHLGWIRIRTIGNHYIHSVCLAMSDAPDNPWRPYSISSIHGTS